MSISEQLYNQLEQNYGKYASWAIWDVSDITIRPTKKDITKMRTDVVFVALNATALTNTWEAFHVKEKFDRVFSDIVKDSDVCGAYCTDLFKGPVNNVLDPNSNNVGKYMKQPSNRKEFEDRCAAFFKELQSLGNVETVFVFGNVAYELIARYCKNQNFDPEKDVNVVNGKKFVHLIHYSNQHYEKNGPPQYRNQDEMKKYDIALIKMHI